MKSTRDLVMERTTIMLPPELKIEAQNYASELGISVGKLIRDSLQLCLEKNKKDKGEDLLFSSFATFEGSTPEDLAANHDQYLYGVEDDIY
jgi:hypothetical protein